MKKGLLFLTGVLAVALLCACEPHYYSEQSSEAPVEESIEDSTPGFVFGENGFYDTANDAEYLIVSEYVMAKEKGEVFCSGGGHTYYAIVDQNPAYLLCDERHRVYRNTAMPFTLPWEDAEWDSKYPGLGCVQDEGDA